MCHKGTVSGWRYLLGASIAAGILAAQTASVEWRRVGNPSMELGLASPATGPVDSVCYSPDGSRLYARTRSGGVFETNDFESWKPTRTATEPADPPVPAVDHVPEPGAKLTAASAGRVYALGTQLYSSDDGGRSWSNFNRFPQPIGDWTGPTGRGGLLRRRGPIGGGQRIWRLAFALDGQGRSWSGLNLHLPNLAGQPYSGQPPQVCTGARLLVQGLGDMELPRR